MDVPRGPAEHLSDLEDAPDLGGWFGALTTLMNDGDPPVRRFRKDETIMRTGDLADRFFVLLRGTAVVLDDADEKPEIRVESGALLGELGVLFSGRRRRTVVATTPVIAISGTRAELESALQVEAIGSHVASVAARRLAERVAPVPVTTPVGSRILLRPLLPDDRAGYLEALGQVSMETLRTRFFAAGRPPDALVERLIAIDYIDHVAWVAVDSRNTGSLLGVCRLIVSADDPRTAELAIGVIDTHQRQGLGQLLVGTLGVVAQERSVETVTGVVLAENYAMRAVCNKAKAIWARADSGVLEARMAAGDVAALLDADTASRVAAATQDLDQAARLADA